MNSVHPFILHYGYVTDSTGLRRVFEIAQPDEVYNLAAQSHVRVSFDQAEYTADVVATGTRRQLETLREYVVSSGKAGPFLPSRIIGDVWICGSAAK
jgi:GDPmannose 4,6-dehydratase